MGSSYFCSLVYDGSQKISYFSLSYSAIKNTTSRLSNQEFSLVFFSKWYNKYTICSCVAVHFSFPVYSAILHTWRIRYTYRFLLLPAHSGIFQCILISLDIHVTRGFLCIVSRISPTYYGVFQIHAYSSIYIVAVFSNKAIQLSESVNNESMCFDVNRFLWRICRLKKNAHCFFFQWKLQLSMVCIFSRMSIMK
jgi:hypothetical protein